MTIRVLSIDGGGIRGLIPARMLAELERISGRPTADLFDIVAGTSTGGILALGLSRPDEAGRPKYSADTLVDIYVEHGQKIFPAPFGKAGLLGALGFGKPTLFGKRESRQQLGALMNPKLYGNARYSPEGLLSVLTAYFGEARLGEALVDLVVLAYDMASGTPVLFRSSEARTQGLTSPLNPTMVDVARATSAGPTFFPPVQLPRVDGGSSILADGGLAANNPSLVAFGEALLRVRSHGLTTEDVVLLSLGTGTPPTQMRTYQEIASQSWTSLAPTLMGTVFDGTSEVQHLVLARLLGSRSYWRIQVELESASHAMNDATPTNIEALQRTAEELVRLQRPTLEELAGLLRQGV